MVFKWRISTLISILGTIVVSHSQDNDSYFETDLFSPEENLGTSNSFVDWLLGALGGSPTTQPDVPEPEPIDQSQCAACKCGVIKKETRIVGGVMTYKLKYPWMAYLMYNDRFYCGASLLNHKYVLTAGHCVNGFDAAKIKVRFLDHDRGSTSESTHFDRKVSTVILHKKYDTRSFNNDIALLKLEKEVKIEGDVQPVCLPSLGRSYTGHEGIVIGWGVTSQYGSPSNVLHEVKVPIMSNEDCRKTAYGQRRITDNMICAGYSEGKKDSCQGDSGGPLHILNGTFHQVVGVVSWGEGCARPNHPGVYSRVNRYLTWIKHYTQDSCFCTP